jgi:methionyl aminopeptidase
MEDIIIKTPEQIEGIRKSSQLAGQALVYIKDFVKEGVSTEFLDKKIEEFIRQHGAIPATLGYNGYPKSCCISLNEVVCHGIPSPTTILKNGDILNIDVTTILNGYYGDTSAMYTVGEISDEAQKLINVTKHCLNLGIEQVRPGNRVGNMASLSAAMPGPKATVLFMNTAGMVSASIFTKRHKSTIRPAEIRGRC